MREGDEVENEGEKRTLKRSRGEEGPLCKMATQQEGGSLGGGLRRTSRAGRGTNERQRASGRAGPQDPKKGRRGMLRAGSDKEGGRQQREETRVWQGRAQKGRSEASK